MDKYEYKLAKTKLKLERENANKKALADVACVLIAQPITAGILVGSAALLVGGVLHPGDDDSLYSLVVGGAAEIGSRVIPSANGVSVGFEVGKVLRRLFKWGK